MNPEYPYQHGGYNEASLMNLESCFDRGKVMVVVHLSHIAPHCLVNGGRNLDWFLTNYYV